MLQKQMIFFTCCLNILEKTFQVSTKFTRERAIHQKQEGNILFKDTVNFLNIRTPKKFVVITLKFELCGSTIE